MSSFTPINQQKPEEVDDDAGSAGASSSLPDRSRVASEASEDSVARAGQLQTRASASPSSPAPGYAPSSVLLNPTWVRQMSTQSDFSKLDR